MTTPENNGKAPLKPPAPKSSPASSATVKSGLQRLVRGLARVLLTIVGTLFALGVVGMLVFGLVVTLAYPKLPDLDSLTDYRPKIPLRVFSADGVLIGEFGEERRNLVHIQDIPEVMKRAVLAIEDDRFYEHGGVDYQGILRATLANLSGGSGGASTITQQVARNFS